MKLEKICLFTVLVYVPSWLNASSGVDAAVHDLQLWKDIKLFAGIDKNISDAATKVLERHFWYLTEEMSIFSIFSEKLSLQERQTIAKELLRYKRPKADTIARGIPEFPLITENTRIWSCIGAKSWHLFNILNHREDWLSEQPNKWQNMAEFKEAQHVVRNIRVVNDAAERAIKLITEYSTKISKDEDEKQALFQVIENHRKLIPKVDKATLSKL